ncbi:MAG: peptidoglycan editing factor PgeF [Hyphomicrobiaceae bacterium]|nr:peptidoglycan editing factor PgeF [Hyphomicrobiaceae bacterium]
MIYSSTLKSDLLDKEKHIRHAFFTRQGGVSSGIYSSLNCSYESCDSLDLVKENRRRAAAYLNATHSDIVTAHQVHSANVLTVKAPFKDSFLMKADALVCQTPGLAIGVLTADCTPVLFADPEEKVVAAAHAGWRGAMSGILEQTLKEMEMVGAKRSRICAAIGPTIHQSNYQVCPEFEIEFLKSEPLSRPFFYHQDLDKKKIFFDLSGFCYSKLKSESVGYVDNLSCCTYTLEFLFYSYRRARRLSYVDYGRQLSAIVISP